jgi:hypothetical protein
MGPSSQFEFETPAVEPSFSTKLSFLYDSVFPKLFKLADHTILQNILADQKIFQNQFRGPLDRNFVQKLPVLCSNISKILNSYYIFALICKILMFCVFLGTKTENFADQKWSADRTLGNTALCCMCMTCLKIQNENLIILHISERELVKI